MTVPTALGRLSESQRQEYWAALALRNSRGIGPRTRNLLLKYFGSAFEAVRRVDDWVTVPGVRADQRESLKNDKWREWARPEWESSRDLDGRIVLWNDDAYPALLRELPDAPIILYARGDLSLLNNHSVALVGSRGASPARMRLTGDIAAELAASGVTVVSGMARGIDHAAHQAAIGEKGGTIAVLGAGLDIVYPPEHRELYEALGQKGLLLSEFPPGSPPEGKNFPIRNRIISGLSHGVCVVEAAARSGSLITARLALDQNRSVYSVPPLALPKNLEGENLVDSSQGCLDLLEQGAKPVMCATDILVDLLPQLQSRNPREGFRLRPIPDAAPSAPRKKTAVAKTAKKKKDGPKPGLLDLTDQPEPQASILAFLLAHGPLAPDELILQSGLDIPPDRLSSTLLIMEVQGLVRRLPGSRYEVPYA